MVGTHQCETAEKKGTTLWEKKRPPSALSRFIREEHHAHGVPLSGWLLVLVRVLLPLPRADQQLPPCRPPRRPPTRHSLRHLLHADA